MNAIQVAKLKEQVSKYGMPFCTSAEFYLLIDIAEKYFRIKSARKKKLKFYIY